ncbi:hypothetical protein GUJ93_ZPchr0008g11605 [Zizania palustris]|uniref:Peptidase C1A papain C-terminal domain-containing protein n=1 Tax=Zizania palustris TaxID=103762 RepID=A0A8J5RYU8_ZIZPA|nr:hypothetical protein GUJ93_ZPchr0008g11605 [Zizania palustris]
MSLTHLSANLRCARRHQRLDPSAVHGITKFSDLTPAEFRDRFLGLRRGSPPELAAGSEPHEAPILPTDFDWREHSAVGPVKDQGSCGSCWSFNTSGALEGAHYLATGKLECDPSEPRSCDSGCNVAINAVFMQTYIGGVSCPYICGKHLDHGVLLVGYGSAGYAPIRFKEKPYWIIKNSWGENWGM